jgi:hypothetical protein
MADDIQEESLLPIHGGGAASSSGYRGSLGVSKNIKVNKKLSITPAITQFRDKNKKKEYTVKGNTLGLQANVKVNKNLSLTAGVSKTKGKVKYQDGKDKFKDSSFNIGLDFTWK